MNKKINVSEDRSEHVLLLLYLGKYRLQLASVVAVQLAVSVSGPLLQTIPAVRFGSSLLSQEGSGSRLNHIVQDSKVLMLSI